VEDEAKVELEGKVTVTAATTAAVSQESTPEGWMQ